MSVRFVLIETGENCITCPMLNGSDECILQDDDANFNADTWDDLMNDCPARKLPDKKDYKKISDENPMKAWGNGWNACLDAITGEGKQ